MESTNYDGWYNPNISTVTISELNSPVKSQSLSLDNTTKSNYMLFVKEHILYNGRKQKGWSIKMQEDNTSKYQQKISQTLMLISYDLDFNTFSFNKYYIKSLHSDKSLKTLLWYNQSKLNTP